VFRGLTVEAKPKGKGADSTHPIRGTAKRLAEKCAKPRPMGRVLDGLSALKIRGFRMKPVAKLREIILSI
jgi:hypothetical protein